MYNQGVILWNAGKIPEAKKQFEAAVAANPNHAESHYQLGMALLNEGNMACGSDRIRDVPEALAEGPNAPTAKAMVAQLEEMIDSAAVRARLAGVRERIARAAGRAGRDPASVRLIAVSKTFDDAHVRIAAECGQIDFGENKVQEALDKMDRTSDLPLRWHLVGHLQSNKAAKAASRFDVIHSVDGAALLTRLDKAAAAAGRRLDLLVQVDIAGEVTKHGATESSSMPIFAAARTLHGGRHRRADAAAAGGRRTRGGSSVLPPAAATSALACSTRGVEPAMLGELSMGMSDDFEVAVEEGATLVRVGTAIFGGAR